MHYFCYCACCSYVSWKPSSEALRPRISGFISNIFSQEWIFALEMGYQPLQLWIFLRFNPLNTYPRPHNLYTVQRYSPMNHIISDNFLGKRRIDLHKALICFILYVLLPSKWLIQIQADRTIFQSSATASILSLAFFKSLPCGALCHWEQYCPSSSAMHLILAPFQPISYGIS